MAKTVTPDSIIAAAESEVSEAQAAAEAVETAARNGDDTATLEQLDAAQKRLSWARIQRDAADKRAAKRQTELDAQSYKQVLAANLPLATTDHSSEIEALLAQARPFIQQAIALVRDSNRSVYKLAAYADGTHNYRAPGDRLEGQAFSGVPGASWFQYNGKRAEWTPAVDIAKDLLRPLRDELRAGSGGLGGPFLDAL